MSTASSPNPQNLLLIGALGVGAYWFMTRGRAYAGQVPQPAQIPGTTAGKWQTIGQGVGVLGQLFGTIKNGLYSNSFYSGNASPSKVGATAVAARRDEDPDLNGSPLDLVQVDGLAFNPSGNVSPYDYTREAWY